MDADVVVIGSGAGGLSGALPLAQAGHKVIVIEQHQVPGGLCHSFRSGAYRFSPGIHYVGQLHEGDSMRQIYEGLDIAQDLTFIEMNPDGYEHVQVGHEKFDIPAGRQATVERFKQRFPKDAKGIEQYFFLIERICQELPVIPETRSFIEFLTVPYRTRHMGRYGLQSLQSTMDRHMKDPLLKAFLSAQCGDHGLPPSRTPFALHAAVIGHYLEGGFYPKGGGRAIPRAYVRGLKKHNTELLLSTSVEKILTEKTPKGRKAIAVKLSDDTEISAKHIISNASPHITYEQLLGRNILGDKILKKLDKVSYTVAPIMLYLATDLDLEDMGFDSGNYWYSENEDFESYYQKIHHPEITEIESYPGLFLGISSLKDPSSYRNKHHVIEIVSFIGYEIFRQWEHSKHSHRPASYTALKTRLTQAMLNTADKLIPGLSKNLVHCEMSTPLTNDYFVRSTRGSSYGTEKILKQIGPFSFNCRTEIENLWLCGASTTAHGLSGATLSGLGVAGNILGLRPSELLTHNGKPLNIEYR